MERFWSKVDKSGDCWLWTAALDSQGYGRFYFDGRLTGAHQFAFGPVPDGLVLDHKCHTKNCVRPDHLRAVTQKQNTENLAGVRANNTTGYRGIYYNETRKLWIAQVGHNGKRLNLGGYSTKEEAAQVASDKRDELFTNHK